MFCDNYLVAARQGFKHVWALSSMLNERGHGRPVLMRDSRRASLNERGHGGSRDQKVGWIAFLRLSTTFSISVPAVTSPMITLRNGT